MKWRIKNPFRKAVVVSVKKKSDKSNVEVLLKEMGSFNEKNLEVCLHRLPDIKNLLKTHRAFNDENIKTMLKFAIQHEKAMENIFHKRA